MHDARPVGGARRLAGRPRRRRVRRRAAAAAPRFSAFSGPERRAMGEIVRTSRAERRPASPVERPSRTIDDETRGCVVLAVLAHILGVGVDEHDDETRLQRWRLVLGERGRGVPGRSRLAGELGERDRVLAGALRQARRERAAASAARRPNVARWLGDIRNYFPSQRRAGHAEGRARAAGPAPDAARARAARAPSSPTCTSSRPSSRSARSIPGATRETARRGRAQGRRRARAPLARARSRKPSAARSPARPARAARACATSTGTAPSARTCATTIREHRTVIAEKLDRPRPPAHRRCAT